MSEKETQFKDRTKSASFNAWVMLKKCFCPKPVESIGKSTSSSFDGSKVSLQDIIVDSMPNDFRIGNKTSASFSSEVIETSADISDAASVTAPHNYGIYSKKSTQIVLEAAKRSDKDRLNHEVKFLLHKKFQHLEVPRRDPDILTPLSARRGLSGLPNPPASPIDSISTILRKSVITDYRCISHLVRSESTVISVYEHMPTQSKVIMKRQSKKQSKIPHLMEQKRIQVQLESNQQLSSSVPYNVDGNDHRRVIKQLRKSKAIPLEPLVMQKLKHNHIARIYTNFSTESEDILVLEYLQGGDLFDQVEPNKGCEPKLAKSYLEQMLDGLAYMHGRGIAHRDIKPENLALDQSGKIIKFIDFGLSGYFGTGNRMGVCKCEPVGTVPYMSPELIKTYYHRRKIQRLLGNKAKNAMLYNKIHISSQVTELPSAYLPAADIWALGIVLFTMITGRFPWTKAIPSESPEFKRFMEDDLDFYPWNKLPTNQCALLRMMLEPNVIKRANVVEVKEYISTHWESRDIAQTTTMDVVTEVEEKTENIDIMSEITEKKDIVSKHNSYEYMSQATSYEYVSSSSDDMGFDSNNNNITPHAYYSPNTNPSITMCKTEVVSAVGV